MRGRASGCALLVGAALWSTPWLTPARADAVDVTLNVGHAQLGDPVHVTVTPGCDASGVRLALSGRSAEGDETGTAEAAADAASTASGTWEGDLVVAGDLAAPQVVDVTAHVVCGGVESTGSTPLRVDAFDTQDLAGPGDTARGQRAPFEMTGGRGSCWSAWVTDSDGATWWLFTSGRPEGRQLDSEASPASHTSTWLSGSFEVPVRMPLGAASLTVHCSQSVDRSARFDVLPASAAPTATPADEDGGASPSADSRRTGSSITLGGGLPVVTASAEPADPRFPLPTLAPPLEATAPPVVVASVPAASRGTWLGWWALLGLLAVPVLALPWLARRRHRPA